MPLYHGDMQRSRVRWLSLLLVVVAGVVWLYTRTPAVPETYKVFIVSRTATSAQIKEKLTTQAYMQGRPLFGVFLLMHGGYWRVAPGGYKLSADMSSWDIAATLTRTPLLKWVTIPEGLRREQVADRISAALGWEPAQREAFLAADVQTPYDLRDGFYFPDTYLIPITNTPKQVVQMFINQFNDNFLPFVPQLREANIKYDTAIKLASLIQREAAGTHDMPLIAGILWNRLNIKMPLQIDATLQYVRGNTGQGYWAPITVADKKTESPYNTYLHAGLPAGPIASPGIAAIEAVLRPEETECLYYIHDNNRQIHCAVTYAEHVANINAYLK